MSTKKKKRIQKNRAKKKENTKSKENSDIKVGYYVVAVLDILNQKEKLATMNRLPEGEIEDKDTQAFIKQLKDTYGLVEIFRKQFDDLLTSFYNIQSTGILAELSKNNPEVARVRNFNIKKHYFSDSIVFYYPLAENNESLAIANVQLIISVIAHLQLIMFARGIIFRGGIDMGIGCEFLENEIYGNALYKAYNIENNIAKYPRVVIGKDMIDYIKDNQSNATNDFIGGCKTRMAETCLNLIKQDSYDNQYVINPVNQSLYEHIPHEDYMKVYTMALLFIKNEIERFASEGNTKLEKRYIALENLLSS